MNQQIKRFTSIILSFLLIFSMVTISTPKKAYAAEVITKNAYGVDGGSGSYKITVATKWSVKSSVPWITFTGKTSGGSDELRDFTISYNVLPNKTETDRIGVIQIYFNTSLSTSIIIPQKGLSDPFQGIVILETPAYYAEAGACTTQLVFKSAEKWYIDNNSNFLTVSQTSGPAALATNTIKISMPENNTPSYRSGYLLLHNWDYSIQKKISITQKNNPVIKNLNMSSHLVSSGTTTTLSFTSSCYWEFMGLPSFVTASIYYGPAGTYNITLTVARDVNKGQTGTIEIYANGYLFTQDIYVSNY